MPLAPSSKPNVNAFLAVCRPSFFLPTQNREEESSQVYAAAYLHRGQSSKGSQRTEESDQQRAFPFYGDEHTIPPVGAVILVTLFSRRLVRENTGERSTLRADQSQFRKSVTVSRTVDIRKGIRECLLSDRPLISTVGRV